MPLGLAGVCSCNFCLELHQLQKVIADKCTCCGAKRSVQILMEKTKKPIHLNHRVMSMTLVQHWLLLDAKELLVSIRLIFRLVMFDPGTGAPEESISKNEQKRQLKVKFFPQCLFLISTSAPPILKVKLFFSAGKEGC